MLAAADEVPDVVLRISTDFWDHHREQRQRWLAWVVEDLSAVCNVRIVGSRLALKELVEDHREDLPASVREPAHQQLNQQRNRARREETVATADRALDDFDPASENYRDWWDMLWTVYETPAERRKQSKLHEDYRIGVGRTTVSKRVSALEDAGLVERPTINGANHVRLTPAGVVAVEEFVAEFGAPDEDRGDAEPASTRPEADHEDCGRSTGHTGPEGQSEETGPCCGGAEAERRARETCASRDPQSQRSADQSGADVSAPPKSSAGTVLPPREHGRGEDGRSDRPATEAAAATADRDRSTRTAPRTTWMDRWRHDSLRSVASDGDVTLSDRPATDRESPGHSEVSYDDRGEVVVSVEGDKSVARVATRLCDTLLSEKLLRSALTPAKLDGSDVNLSGLKENNVVVLQKARCIGWLEHEEKNGKALHDRLRAARNALTDLSSRLSDDEGRFDPVVASELTTDALGLFGTAVHLLDLLDVDVTVEIEWPEFRRNHYSNAPAICRFTSKLVRICSRYGHYAAERTLFEPRDKKREDALGAPAVDQRDPVGTSLVNWIMSGPGIEDLAAPLRAALDDPPHDDLQQDGLNFAEFVVPVEVVQGWRRSAVAVLLSRMANWKHLEATRQVIAVLRALLGSVHDVARALDRLGAEDSRWDRRDLRLDELRYALVEGLPPGRVLPKAGDSTVSQAVHALLAAGQPVSASQLADRAGVSTQSLRDNRDLLEAVGLVHVDDGEAGETSTWRLTLPFSDEDREDLDAESGALPLAQLTGEDAPLALFDGDGFAAPLHFGVETLLLRMGWSPLEDEEGLSDAIAHRLDDPADIRPVVEVWPWLRRWVDILAALSGHGWRRSVAQEADDPADVVEDLPSVPHGTGDWSATAGPASVEEWGRGPLRLSSEVGTRPPQRQTGLTEFPADGSSRVEGRGYGGETASQT
jgi:DNA-binding MarR family transcriptional regulator